ncbi:MAG TPA: hypothetical protein VGV15_09365 [Terriglobales bacterium]|nr:hypothetical protein [Terriglobales bacterium]
MQRLKTVGICMVVVLSLVAIALAAVNIKTELTFVANNDGSYTATGELTGLGKTPAVATITISESATYTCVNNGGNTAAGQSQVTTHSSGSQDLGNSNHNGDGVYDLTVPAVTPPPDMVSGTVAGCPNSHNSQWTGVKATDTGASAVFTLTQGSKSLVTSLACDAGSGSCPQFPITSFK